jgi:3-hydroxyacyl-[acyl-carrier-protein] dehydratase
VTATPLTVPPRLTAVDGEGPVTIAATVRVDPDNPLFAGHYPGFPIFPGVCLIEAVHQSVLLAADRLGRDVRLSEIRGTRFLAPAFPGDDLDVTVRFDGAKAEGVVRRDGEDIAKVRLTYGGDK